MDDINYEAKEEYYTYDEVGKSRSWKIRQKGS